MLDNPPHGLFPSNATGFISLFTCTVQGDLAKGRPPTCSINGFRRSKTDSQSPTSHSNFSIW